MRKRPHPNSPGGKTGGLFATGQFYAVPVGGCPCGQPVAFRLMRHGRTEDYGPCCAGCKEGRLADLERAHAPKLTRGEAKDLQHGLGLPTSPPADEPPPDDGS